MKKTIAFVMCTLLISSCSGDRLIDENFLMKSYNTETQDLDLSDLGLTAMPDFSSFTGSEILTAKTLNLAENDISLLDMSMLKDFADLRELNVSDNEITIVKNLNTDMDLLNLSDNDLEILSFASGSILKELDLSSNNLRFWGDIAMLPLTISTLDLSDNRLQNIDGVWKLMRLKYLDISNNELSDLDMKELSSQKLLQYIDISENPEMSKERIDAMKKYNDKYIEKQNEQKQFNKTMTGSLTQ